MSDALLPCPKSWRALLTPFASCFTKPQFGNFCSTTSSIVLSQHSSISRFAALSGKHQSTLNDFFSVSPWDDSLVREKLSRITVRRVKDAQIGIIDDTLSHHPYAKKIDHAGWYHDGLTKTEQLGHSIVTHGVHSPNLGFVPFDLELYKKDGRSKNDIACEMIHRTQRLTRLKLYLVDSWYSNVLVLGSIRRHKSHYITEIKSNRKINIDNKLRYVREHERHIPAKEWVTVTIHNHKYRYFQTSGFIAGLGNLNLVYSQKYDEDDKRWTETYYIVSDILSLSGERVIELFLLRGGIEGFHREAKQQLGLEDNHLRNSRGIERYLILVLLVFVLLILLNQQLMEHTFERKSIGEMREYLKAEYLTTLFENSATLNRDQIEKQAKLLAYAL